MALLQNINQLRAVGNWATTYLWDIRFLETSIGQGGSVGTGGATSLQPPFDDWFPADSVEEPLYQIETYQLRLHLLETEIPKTTGGRQIVISCYDNAEHVVEWWLKTWFDKAFNKYMAVSPLLSIIKVLEVQRLMPDKTELFSNRYYVFPKGAVNVSQNSQSAAKKLNFTLAVAGMETQHRIRM